MAFFKNAEDLFEKAFEFLPKEVEGIQAMAFYAWIKSKMHKTDFYETVLVIENKFLSFIFSPKCVNLTILLSNH